MPIWLILLVVVGSLGGMALAIYAMTRKPSATLFVIGISIISVALLASLITIAMKQDVMVTETPQQSSEETTQPIISAPATETEIREGTTESNACYWVWTNRVLDPTDRWGNLLLPDEPIVECTQPGWYINGENIPPYCWCP